MLVSFLAAIAAYLVTKFTQGRVALRSLYKNTSGQGFVEYSILVSLIGIVGIIAVTKFGSAVSSSFSYMTTQLPK